MAKARVRSNIEVVLILSKEEAEYLIGVTQNPWPNPETLEDFEDEMGGLRTHLFTVLKEALD